jgi:hypothetical protein
MADRFASVVTPIDFGFEGISLIEVRVSYGSQHYDEILNDKKPEGRLGFVAEENAGPDLHYSYRAYMRGGLFAQGSQIGFSSEPRTTDGTMIIIDPRELYRRVLLGASAVFSLEKYRSAFIDFKLEVDGDPANTLTIQLNEDFRDFREGVAIRLGAKFNLQHRVRHVLRQGAVIEGPWQPTEAGIILVGEPEVVAV